MHFSKNLLKKYLMSVVGGTLFIGASLPESQYAVQKIPSDKPLVPVLVIGSGPAGLAAAEQAAQFKLPVYVVTGDELGGQLVGSLAVDNMPGFETQPGASIMEKIEQKVRAKGVSFVHDSVTSVDFSTWPFVVTTQAHGSFYALSVVIATGSTPRKLSTEKNPVPGETTYYSKGVYTCAVCDCFVTRGKDVAIVGGGDSAVTYAEVLAPYAKSITLFVRRDSLRAAPTSQEKLARYPHVKVVYSTRVVEILGNGELMTDLVVENVATGERSTQPFQAIFLAIGHDPNTALFAPYIRLTSHGYIELASRSQQTSVPGVFAAGDVEDDYFRQAAIAIGHGMQAGHEAAEFVRNFGFSNEDLSRYVMLT